MKTFDKELFWQYVKACTNLYGVVTIDQVIKLFMDHNPGMSIKKEDVLRLRKKPEWKEWLEDSLLDDLDGGFAHLDVLIEEIVWEITMMGADEDWYMPKKEELLPYADHFYAEPTEQYVALKNYVEPSYPTDAEYDLDEALYEMRVSLQVSPTLEDALPIFVMMFGTEDKKDLQTRIDLFVDFANHYRMWRYKGHHRAEIGEEVSLHFGRRFF
ncbi:hypothetical protein [Planococcus sp. ISL-109]|uniref:hypothetical protein n=1 Tax=Planococcus sp. ISL-109 TaxID=2819166 RepID=UPI001BE5DFDF|nr:hypothetical protein [Planococcus sp. ISL-109]MBT2583965.1 hypothetical protein [Planococcus sp. ISL-109]